MRAVLDAERVVEVARGLGIDGQNAAVAQIDAIGEVVGPELLRRAPGRLAGVVGELVGDVGEGDDLLDLGARIVGIAEHVRDARRQRARGARVG